MLALVAGVAVAALRSDGYKETRVNLNDAGVWVTSRAKGAMGRLNTQIKLIEVKFGIDQAMDVVQLDDTVVELDPAKHQMAVVDVGMAQPGDVQKLPTNGEVLLGGPNAAVVDPGTGKVWVVARSELRALDVATADPTVRLGKGIVGAVDTAGVLHAFDPKAGKVTAVDTSGELAEEDAPRGFADPQVATVGTRPVVLDGRSGKLQVIGGRSADLPKGSVIQQPGPDNDAVLVATDDALVAVPLSGGSSRELDTDGSGDPAAPVYLDGCSYGAWSTSPRWTQQCGGGNDRSGAVPGIKGSADLTFRVNRHRVVLNDRVSGDNLLFTDREPIRVTDWNQAESRDKQRDQQETVTVKNKDKCGDKVKPPAPVEDESGTRPGRPVIVHVLENDKVDPCDVVMVANPKRLPESQGTVAVVDSGTALQVTPAPSRQGAIEVSYKVRGAGGEADGRLTVNVVPDGAKNRTPVTRADQTVVDAGKTVDHDVLVNDYDPDGDSLSLVAATVDDGSIQYEADGLVKYTAPGNASGTKVISYTVRDEQNAESKGELKVVVTPAGANDPPKARADRLVAFVGRDAQIDLLKNDTDPNGDRLQVSKVDVPKDLDADWTTGGKLRVRGAQPGSYTFGYQITDGKDAADGRVRVEVRASNGNTPPVAVRDDVVVRPGTPALVDLVANDIDLDGDVLAVTSIEPPDDGTVSVELLEMRTVRVTSTSALARSVAVRYWVSDGGAPVPGVLVVRPLVLAEQDQPPITGLDAVTLRAGNVVGIQVLRNDRDPEGEQLHLRGEPDIRPGQGSVFRQGDELRYQAPEKGNGTYILGYTAVDPGGNRSAGRVEVTVIPKATQNRAPDAQVLDARVVSGKSVTVAVPLLGADPDGDPVALMGVASAPGKGSVVVGSDSLVYTADLGATGGDSFTYTIRDRGGLSATGKVRVAIAPLPTTNGAPVGVPDKVSIRAGATQTIPVLANDVDPDGDAIVLLDSEEEGPTKPGLGTVVGLSKDKRSIIYKAPSSVPAAGTQDSFSYGLADVKGTSARGLVTITIQRKDPENLPPVAHDDFAKPQLAGQKVKINVLANDYDPDDPGAKLQVEPIGQPGARVVSGGIEVTTGPRSFAFTYEVTDADEGKARAVVVVPVVDRLPPVANPDLLKVDAGRKATVNVLANDGPKDRTLRLVRVTSARGGRAVVVDKGGRVRFEADGNVVGGAGFSYVMTDGRDEAVGFVTVQVKGRNSAPTFQATTVQVPAGSTKPVRLQPLVSDLNVTDDHAFSSPKSSSGKVKASIADGVLSLRADDDAKGTTARVTLVVSDGTDEVQGVVNVVVTGSEGPPPVAVPDVDETTQGKAITVDVTANDVDPLKKGLTVRVMSMQGGKATEAGTGSIRFQPDASFFGVAVVTYRILDATKDETRASETTLRINVIGFPGKPGAPNGESGESRLVRLSWGAPASNGAPITGYVVRTNTGQQKTFPSNSGVFDGLTNGNRYRFQVAARNKAVTSDSELVWSEYSPEIIPDTKPGAPTPPSPKFGDRQITVTWSPGQNEGSAITGYTLTASPSVGGPVKLGAGARSYTMTGLTNGTAYTFTLYATNAAGDSPTSSSNPGDPNATPAGKPFAPTVVNATRLDKDVSVGGTVMVDWGFDSNVQGNGDAPQSFTVTGSNGAGTKTAGTNDRAILFSGLTNGTSYTFTVTATNKAGVGESATSPAVKPAKVPAQISGVSATEGDTQAPLTFSTPDDGGEPITGYQVTSNRGSVSSSGGGVTQTGGLTATGLTNGTDYSFQVRACNAVGCGEWSPSSNTVNPYGDPGQPGVSASVNGTSITWNWSAPSGNGRPIDHYRVWLDGSLINGNFTGTSYSQSFGYSEGHTLSVSAVNTGNREGPQGSASATTSGPPVSVSISKTGNAQGQPGCTDSSCAYIRVQLNGFGGGSHSFECWSSLDGSGPFYTYSNSATVTSSCYYGYPGRSVWVVVDGTKSNTITW